MLNKNYLLSIILIALCIFTLTRIYTPALSQDSELPPLVIKAQDFPMLQGQSVTMQKELWGDKNEVCFEVSVLEGTKNIQGINSQVIKSYDSSGETQEDYFTIDSGSFNFIGTTRDKINKLVPAKNFQFPLKLNSEWTVLNKQISGKNVLITAKVVSHEFIKVPAGIFQSLKIAITSGFANEKRVENSYIWVAPRIGVVKEIQQIDENQTQIRELICFHPGDKSLISKANSIPSGGRTWNGSGKGYYTAVAKHPSGKTLEQNMEISYVFSFTHDQQTGLIKGNGQVTIDKYKNSWSGKSYSGSKGNFTFIGKKEGEVFKFYDGFVSLKGDTAALNVVEQAFRLSAPISNGIAKANLSLGKDNTKIKIQWQAQ